MEQPKKSNTSYSILKQQNPIPFEEYPFDDDADFIMGLRSYIDINPFYLQDESTFNQELTKLKAFYYCRYY